LADVVLSPYFTKDNQFHQHDSSHGGQGGSLPNDFSQIKFWYNGVLGLGMDAVIFHNELSKSFTLEYETDKIKFVEYQTEHRPSFNDNRFYAYYEYILNNKNIDRVFCTDLYDVVFYKNPFDLMDQKKEYSVFSGSEMITKSSSAWMTRKCKEMKYRRSREGFSKSPIYNAGIIGGYRSVILNLFESMINEMNSISKTFNANMPVYNYCLENQKNINVFTGFPLHNIFKSNRVEDGVFIKHK
jgi:hypothetical protein